MKSIAMILVCLLAPALVFAAGYTFSNSSSTYVSGVTISDGVQPSTADCTDEVTAWKISVTIPANTIDGGADGEYDLEFVGNVYDRNDNLLYSCSQWLVRSQSDDALMSMTNDVFSWEGDCSGGWPGSAWVLDGGDYIEVDVWAWGEPNDGELLGGSVFASTTTGCN